MTFTKLLMHLDIVALVICELKACGALNARRVDATRTTLVRRLAFAELLGANARRRASLNLVEARHMSAAQHQRIQPFGHICIIKVCVPQHAQRSGAKALGVGAQAC